MASNPHIVDLSQAHKLDEDLVNKKVWEIGTLWRLGIPLPQGFVITKSLFEAFLSLTGIDNEIRKIQALSHPSISSSMEKLFEPIQRKILHTQIPQVLADELHKSYREISGTFKEKSLNIHSFSFKNKSATFSDVKGDANLILKIKNIWAKSITDPTTIIVQENIKHQMKGKTSTDDPSFNENLTKLQISELTSYCKKIQKHFYFPHEIEYLLSKGRIFITGINLFTGEIAKTTSAPIAEPLQKREQVKKEIVRGVSINPGIATGPVKILFGKYKDAEIKRGEVVILHDLNSSLLKNMQNAKAIIADATLPTPLSKTVYRKLFKVPTVEGVRNATRLFHNGNVVTVNGTTGEIYAGGLI